MAATLVNTALPTNADARFVIDTTIKNGGGSFFPGYLEELVGDATGYMVSIDPARGLVLDLGDFTESAVMVWIANNREYVSQYPDNLAGVRLFGTWVNEGQVHLDVATWVDDLDAAMALGRKHGQLAIYDLVAGEDINL